MLSLCGMLMQFAIRELEAGRSASPFPGSENGNVSDDSKGTSKSKTKSRTKHVGVYLCTWPDLRLLRL